MTKPNVHQPDSNDMVMRVRAKAMNWLKSQEANSLLDSNNLSTEAVRAIEDYFSGWRPAQMKINDIVEYFIVGYLQAGTSNGAALRSNLVSAIVRCDKEDTKTGPSDRLNQAQRIRDTCPEAFRFMVKLAEKHSTLCREVLRAEYDSDVIELRRGVDDDTCHFVIESWSYGLDVSGYGHITLRAQIPLDAVLSIREYENEIVVFRTLVASESIIVEQP